MKAHPLAALIVGFIIVQAWFARAEEPDGKSLSFRLLDADGAPLAGAKALVFPGKESDGKTRSRTSITLQRDPLAGVFIPRSQTDGGHAEQYPLLRVSDASGRVAIPVPPQAATMLVMNERGIACLHEGQWNQKGGDVRASLQAWASLSGTVTLRGKPAAGIFVEFSRFMASASIGGMFDLFIPPVCHRIAVRTGKDGRFKIERLLPTALDGPRHVPYEVSEKIGADPDLKAEDVYAVSWDLMTKGVPRSGFDIGRSDLTFAAGEHRDFDLAATPPCEREVSGRLAWADGTPMQRTDFRDHALNLSPLGFGGMSGSFPVITVGADGRFKGTVPFAGKWALPTGDLNPVGGKAWSFEFILPDTPNENGKGAPVDIGEIIFQKAGRAKTTPPKTDGKGMAEIAFTVLDEHHQPMPGASARIDHLISASKSSSRYLYPKNLPAARTDAAGVAHVKVPVNFRDADGRRWPITGAALGISRDGCEATSHEFALGEKGAVLVLKTAASVSVRVLKEGRPVPLAQMHIFTGWADRGRDCFEHPKWKATADGALRRDAAPPGRWQLQAGHLDAEKWRWFSEVAEVTAPGQKEPALLTLRRGVRVGGTLHADVPRPVKRGIVRVVIRMPPPPDASAEAIYWSDWQKVDESGAFVFRGLPPGDAWIAASCEGWISEAEKSRPKRLPGGKNWADPISMLWSAVPFHVNPGDTNVTVPMVRTGTVVFRFKHENGKPVAKVWPYFDAGLNLGPVRESLADTGGILDHVLGEPDDNAHYTGEFLPSIAEDLDAKGTIRLENLPPTRVRLGLKSGDRSLRPADASLIPSDHFHDQFAPFQADVKPGEVVEKEFVVSSKE